MKIAHENIMMSNNLPSKYILVTYYVFKYKLINGNIIYLIYG